MSPYSGGSRGEMEKEDGKTVEEEGTCGHLAGGTIKRDSHHPQGTTLSALDMVDSLFSSTYRIIKRFQ